MSTIEQDIKNCFQLKADFFPITVFKVTSFNLPAMSEQLQKTIESAPKYFHYAPMIVDTQELKEPLNPDNLEKLCNLLRKYNIIPVGLRGLEKLENNHSQNDLIKTLNLALFQKAKAIPSLKTETPEKSTSFNATKIITKPIRSGTRVYAKNADLIILSAINAGGECIADGNIHVYGPLRGRVLAGATGNTEARIFCKKLEAELISIAGHYLTSEEIKVDHSTDFIHIFLKNNAIKIETL